MTISAFDPQGPIAAEMNFLFWVLAGMGTAVFVAFAVLMLWHAAVPYQAAVRHEWVHALEHGSFLLVGFGFWHVALGRGRDPLTPGFRVLFMFTAAMQGVVLAALLTFGSTPWYPAYTDSATGLGIDPLTDQQLAGLLMWIPSGLVYTTVSLVVLVRWIAQSDRVWVPMRLGREDMSEEGARDGRPDRSPRARGGPLRLEGRH